METSSTDDDSQKTKLSPAARLFQSPIFNCYIVAIVGCNSTIGPEIIKDGLTHNLLKRPRFSSKLFCRRRRWVRTHVKLNDHVFTPTLDSKIENPDQFVEDYISHLTTTPLDFSKPPWELHLLNVKTTDSESLVIFRIHYSVGDGESLMSLLISCTRRTSDRHALPTLPAPVKRLPLPDEGGFFVRLLRFLTTIWSAITLIWNTIVDVMVFAATILFPRDTKTPIKGPPGVERSTKRFVHRSISLGDIKFIKNAMNTTINDVLLGVTQAGLSWYLNRRYGQIETDQGTKRKANFLPKKIRLNSTIFVNLRPTVGIQALADMMDKNSKAKWGNLLGYLLLPPFNIALEDNPLDYVRQPKAIIDRKKHSFEAHCTCLRVQLLQKILGADSSAATARRAIFNTTVAFSNMTGQLEEVSFCGHQIAYLAPSVYGHPHSYVEKMTIVLAVDPDVIPDPRQLFDDLEESLKHIREAVIKLGLNKETV